MLVIPAATPVVNQKLNGSGTQIAKLGLSVIDNDLGMFLVLGRKQSGDSEDGQQKGDLVGILQSSEVAAV